MSQSPSKKKSVIFIYVLTLFTTSLLYGQYAKEHYIAPAPWSYFSNSNLMVLSVESGTASISIYYSDGTLVPSSELDSGSNPISVTEGQPVKVRFASTTSPPPHPINSIISGQGLYLQSTVAFGVNLRNIDNDQNFNSGCNSIKGNASLTSFGNQGQGLAFRLGYYRQNMSGIVNCSSFPINPSQQNQATYAIMATTDDTDVTFNGTTLTTLNRGESYLIQSSTIGDLLESNKPVVVNVGARQDAPGGCGDSTFDQINPISQAGNEFVFVRGNGTAGTAQELAEQTTVIATEHGTTFVLNHYDVSGNQFGVTANITLSNPGDHHTFHHGDQANRFSTSHIVSNKPLIAFSGTADNCEVDISTVPPVENCTGSLNIETRKFRNFPQTNDLEFFGYIIIESATETIYIDSDDDGDNSDFYDVETLPNVNPRFQLGTTGFYMLPFERNDIYHNGIPGTPTNLKFRTDNVRFSMSIVQQGSGTSMSAYFSSFNYTLETPEQTNNAGGCTELLTAEPGFAPYQWFLNDVQISGATAQTYTPTQAGNYSVLGNRACGQTKTSSFSVVSCLPEDCNNGIDDDGDGLVDCNDPDCVSSDFCTDTDNDGVIDKDDLDDDNDGIEDTIENPETVLIFTYTGADQSFTVPSGFSQMKIQVWGAGGGGEGSLEPGGVGGYVEGTLNVTSGDNFSLMVGEGGVSRGSGDAYGFGGRDQGNNDGSGGGLSGVFSGTGLIQSTDASRALLIAGGGGAGGYIFNGTNYSAIAGRSGGELLLSGGEPTFTGSDDSAEQNSYLAGGGGYQGGSSPFFEGGYGGSNYIDLSVIRGITAFSKSGAVVPPPDPPYNMDTNYQAGVGTSGFQTTNGGNGLIVITLGGRDTDNDSVPDYLDADSDGDGCFDTLEAGFTDGDSDGLLGSSPVSVDANGLVTGSGGYTAPGTEYIDDTLFSFCDDDNDGVINDSDVCPGFDDMADNDTDGVPDGCDLDDDNDGILDTVEQCSFQEDFNDQTLDSFLEESGSNSAPPVSIDYSGNNASFSHPTNDTRTRNYIRTVANNFYDQSVRFEVTAIIPSSNSPAGTPFVGLGPGEANPAYFGEPLHPILGANIRLDLNRLYFHDKVPGDSYGSSNSESLSDVSNTQVRFRIDWNAETKMARIEVDVNYNGSTFVTDYSRLFDGSDNTFNSTNMRVYFGGGSRIIFDDFEMLVDCDTDLDGVPNRVDLDSDNDGIYDVVESGGIDANGDGIHNDDDNNTDNSATNGVPSAANGGTGNTPTDTGSDGTFDFLNTDADGDGCNDVIEAGFTDGDTDAELGSAPITVDGDGVITGQGGYTTPQDLDGNGTMDFIEITSNIIEQQPESQNGIVGGSASFAVISSSDTYQWQVSTDFGATYTNISGADQPSLVLNNLLASQDGTLYRVLVSNRSNVCVEVFSFPVLLSVDTDHDADGVFNREDEDDDNDGILDDEENQSNTSTLTLTGDFSAVQTGGAPLIASDTNAGGIGPSDSNYSIQLSSNIQLSLGTDDILESCTIRVNVGRFDDGLRVDLDGVRILDFNQTHWRNDPDFQIAGLFNSDGNTTGSFGWTPWLGEGNAELIISPFDIKLMLDTRNGDRQNALPYMRTYLGSGDDTFIYNPVDFDCAAGVLFDIFNSNQQTATRLQDVQLNVEAEVWADTDGDTFPDHRDLDSDDDGCNDVIEAGFTDGDTDAELGSAPITVDGNGLVTSAVGYTTPNDNNGNSVFDFQEVGGGITFSTVPTDIAAYAGDTVNYSVDSNVNYSYQWQLSTDGGLNFNDIAASPIYTGVQDATLTINNVTVGLNGYLYRVVVTDLSFVCTPTISPQALLTVAGRSVITNRRITYRVKN